MRPFLLVLLLLTACQAEDRGAAIIPQSPCRAESFEQSRFTVCSANGGAIEIRTSNASGEPYRSFAALQSALGTRADRVAFAMNAGMFDEKGHAIGLLIEDGEELHAINRREGGGNFHMLPNGVFIVRRDGTAEIVTSEDFEPSDGIVFATQSGPILLIDGKLHPRFDHDGESRHFRNGVGIAPDGTPMFVISQDPVSFGRMGRFFRDELKAQDALYFDGAVSALWDPANGRRDTHSPLGPMVVVFEKR